MVGNSSTAVADVRHCERAVNGQLCIANINFKALPLKTFRELGLPFPSTHVSGLSRRKLVVVDGTPKLVKIPYEATFKDLASQMLANALGPYTAVSLTVQARVGVF